jgi:hypothetical protein
LAAAVLILLCIVEQLGSLYGRDTGLAEDIRGFLLPSDECWKSTLNLAITASSTPFQIHHPFSILPFEATVYSIVK